MAFDFQTLPIKGLCVGWTILGFNVNAYLGRRQMKRVKKAMTEPLPTALEGLVTLEQHREAASYSYDKLSFSQYEEIFSLVMSVASYWFLPALWNWTSTVVPLEHEFTHTVFYMYLSFLPLSIFSTFTFDMYKQFVIEEKHGFNKMTISLYITDFLKSQALLASIGLPILYLFIKVARWGGRSLYIYLWVFSLIMQLILIAIVPVVVLPWFNKYEPLQNTELREKIEGLASTLEFPLYKLEQVDGSKRSSHSNAFFYGFWRFKRIVLFDTLLDQPHDNILAILGHELGHWKMHHTKFNMGFQMVMMFVIFSLYGMVFDNESIFAAFGYNDPTMSVLLGFLLFSELWKPVEWILSRFFTYVSRVFEYQADTFAVQLGYGEALVAGLKAITNDNKSFSDPDPIYSAYYFTHPTFLERRANILEKMEEAKDSQSKKDK